MVRFLKDEDLVFALELVEFAGGFGLVLRLLSANRVSHRVPTTAIRPNILQSPNILSHYPPGIVVYRHL